MTVRVDSFISIVSMTLLTLALAQNANMHDLNETPRFTTPTNITNQYFPISSIKNTISLGKNGGTNIRIEITPLTQTRIIEWAGGQTEATEVQFVEYVDNWLIEVAYDYFAQSDEGSVYYFGEDVTNYENGAITNHEGSWLAGRDGAPPALIMPANPTVGQIFNSEDLPGIVYETDEVLSLSENTTTPAGPISEGLLLKETLMNGNIESKVYAAGFGIVEERDGEELTKLALLTRSDTSPGVIPEALQTIEAQAEDIIDVVPGGEWDQTNNDIAIIDEAWQAFQASTSENTAPQLFKDAFETALIQLKESSAVKNMDRTLQADNNLSAAVVDLFNVYNPVVPVELNWLDVIERQTVLDSAKNQLSAAANDIAKANAIWVRLRPSILMHNGDKFALEFEANLYSQRVALVAKNASSLLENTNSALEIVDSLERLY